MKAEIDKAARERGIAGSIRKMSRRAKAKQPLNVQLRPKRRPPISEVHLLPGPPSLSCCNQCLLPRSQTRGASTSLPKLDNTCFLASSIPKQTDGSALNKQWGTSTQHYHTLAIHWSYIVRRYLDASPVAVAAGSLQAAESMTAGGWGHAGIVGGRCHSNAGLQPLHHQRHRPRSPPQCCGS